MQLTCSQRFEQIIATSISGDLFSGSAEKLFRFGHSLLVWWSGYCGGRQQCCSRTHLWAPSSLQIKLGYGVCISSTAFSLFFQRDREYAKLRPLTIRLLSCLLYHIRSRSGYIFKTLMVLQLQSWTTTFPRKEWIAVVARERNTFSLWLSLLLHKFLYLGRIYGTY